jgi:hypothetical protein
MHPSDKKVITHGPTARAEAHDRPQVHRNYRRKAAGKRAARV